MIPHSDIQLYDHQKEAVQKLRSGSILCGGVGSGKSRTAIAWFWAKECKGQLDVSKPAAKPKDLYIITTARKRDTGEWVNECKIFGLPRKGTKVVIDSWNNIVKYMDISNAVFLFDEQRAGGHGKWAKTFIRIARKNAWILLSATPGDVWMDYVPVFIANGYYRNRTEFVRRHVVFSRFAKFPKIERYLETGLLEKHRREVIVTMAFQRPTISHHETVVTEFDGLIFNKATKQRWNPYEDRPIRDMGELCGVLRKIVNSDISRVEALKDLLCEHPRAIVFYNFNYELDMLREIDYPKAEWNGQKHEPIPSGDKWIYLVQYSAGAEGWNCTQTDTVIFYSQNYSYKMTTQAAGRIDRLNTPYTDLYYFHFLSDSVIDNAIKKALDRKQNFEERAFTLYPDY